MTCVSELCTNAITHTASGQGGAFTVEVDLPRDGVARLAVTDDGGGPSLPVARPLDPLTADMMAEGGRGLALVAAYTSRWGYVEDGPGLIVWAESCWPVAVPVRGDRAPRRPRPPAACPRDPGSPARSRGPPTTTGPLALPPEAASLPSSPRAVRRPSSEHGHHQNLRKSGRPSCHQISTTLPTMLDPVTGPQNRLSHESARLSPST